MSTILFVHVYRRHLFIITNDHGVPTKFGLRKVKRSRFSANRRLWQSEQMPPLHYS